jgi:tetratricopeptide (TPR) repeat protein
MKLYNKWIIFLILSGVTSGLFSLEQKEEALEAQVWNAPATQLEATEKSLIHHLQESPSSPFSHYLLSIMYLRFFTREGKNGKPLQQALQLAQQAIELNPDGEFGYLAMANVLDVMKKKKEACLILQSLMVRSLQYPISWRVPFHLIRIQEPKTTQTTDQLEALLHTTASETAQEIMIPYLVASGQSTFQGAAYAAQLQKWESEYSTEFLRTQLTHVYIELGQYGKAESLCKKKERMESKDIGAKLTCLFLSYRYLHRSHETLHEFQLLEKTAPSEWKPTIWMHMGFIFHRNGEKKKANAYLEKSLRQSNLQEEILATIAYEYEYFHDNKSLIALLKKVEPDFSNHAALYTMLSELLQKTGAQQEAASRFYEKALLINEDTQKERSSISQSH